MSSSLKELLPAPSRRRPWRATSRVTHGSAHGPAVSCLLCLVLVGMAGCASSHRPPQSAPPGSPAPSAAPAGKEGGATTGAATPPEPSEAVGEGSSAKPGENSSGGAGAPKGKDAGSPAGTSGGEAGREGTSGGSGTETASEGSEEGATSWTARITGSSEAPGNQAPTPKSASRVTSSSGGGGSQAPSSPNGAPGGKPAPSLLLTLEAAPAEVKAGEELVVEILATSSAKIVDAPLGLFYDPALLRFLDASQGDFLSRDGAGAVFLANGQSHPGDVALGIGRTDRAHGVSGEGTLCRVRFVATAPGEAVLQIHGAMAWGEAGESLPVESAPLRVTIR